MLQKEYDLNKEQYSKLDAKISSCRDPQMKEQLIVYILFLLYILLYN